MTTLLQAHEIVAEQFLSVWGNTTPVDLPNEGFQPVFGVPYAEFRIIGMTNEMDSLGGPGNRNVQRREIAQVTIKVPFDWGEGDHPNPPGADLPGALTMAQLAISAFECTTLLSAGVDVDFMEPATPLYAGSSPDGLWYQVVVRAPFVYYDTK